MKKAKETRGVLTGNEWVRKILDYNIESSSVNYGFHFGEPETSLTSDSPLIYYSLSQYSIFAAF